MTYSTKSIGYIMQCTTVNSIHPLKQFKTSKFLVTSLNPTKSFIIDGAHH